MIMNTYIIVELDQNHTFFNPKKEVLEADDMKKWLKSEAYFVSGFPTSD